MTAESPTSTAPSTPRDAPGDTSYDERALVRAEGIEILAPVPPAFAEILPPEALRLVATLIREFGGRRERLLPDRPA